MRIFITPLYGMGDTVLATPAIKILKESLPDSHITVMTMSKVNYEILKNNPYIDELLFVPFLKMNPSQTIKYIVKNLRNKFDVSINLYPSNRRAYNIFSLLVGAKKRLGVKYLHSDFAQLNFFNNIRLQEYSQSHVVEQNLDLIKQIGAYGDAATPMQLYLTDEEKVHADNVINDSKVKIGIHAGCSLFKGHSNKRWATEKFAELINSSPEYSFYIFGGPEDEVVNSKLCELTEATMFAEKDIRKSVALIGKMDAFVSNDSGLMHVAAALNVPTVCIIGPTSHNFIRPWGVKYEIASRWLDCSPCFHYSPSEMICPAGTDFECLKGLDVSIVKNALLKVLL